MVKEEIHKPDISLFRERSRERLAYREKPRFQPVDECVEPHHDHAESERAAREVLDRFSDNDPVEKDDNRGDRHDAPQGSQKALRRYAYVQRSA